MQCAVGISVHYCFCFCQFGLEGCGVVLIEMCIRDRGIGASRQDFDESEEGFTFYMFRPMLSLSYPVFKGQVCDIISLAHLLSPACQH